MPNTLHTFTEIKAADTANMPVEVEILREGSWDGPNHPKFDITAQDIDEYAQNFNAGLRKGVPIDIEHRTSKKYGEDAAGWIQEVFATTLENGKRALMGKPEWNGLGTELVGDKRFRFVSAEFIPRSLGAYADPEGKGKFRNVLKALTITNNPLMKDLKPLTATAGSTDAGGDGASSEFMNNIIYADEGVKSVTLDEIRKKAPDAVTADDKVVLEQHKTELSLAERAAFGLDVAVTPVKPEPVKAADGTVTVKASELAAMEAKMADLTIQAGEGVKAMAQLKASKTEAEVEKHVARGAIKADDSTKWVDRLVKASESDYAMLTETLDALPDNEKLKAGEKGADDKGAIAGQEAALATVRAYATEHGISFSEAMVKATEGNVELARQLMPAGGAK